jgi:hypothetical protein
VEAAEVTIFGTSDPFVDHSLAGPLLDRVTEAPQSWGSGSTFLIADRSTEVYVENELARRRLVAIRALGNELLQMMSDMKDGREPRSVLHGLIVWGPISVPRLAGHLSMTIDQAQSSILLLRSLSIARPVPDYDQYSDVDFPAYEVDSSAIVSILTSQG